MSQTTSSPAASTPDDERIIDASEFDSPGFLADPYPLYRRLRTYHPVYHDRLHNQWHVTRYWDLVEAFRDEEAFGTRPHSYETDGVLGQTMLSLGGAEHAEQRNLVGDALVGRKLDAFTPIVREVARDLVEAFADRGRVNLTQEFTSQLPIRVIMTMLGRHFCIGYQLARREAIVGAQELLRVMKSPRLADEPMDTIKARKRGSSIRSVGDLLVEFDQH
ncbi:MAG: hypothetical protein OXE43_07670 [Chloroflexi bacterium]|nr:hypothetical protein [Chloroflexota bacterium]